MIARDWSDTVPVDPRAHCARVVERSARTVSRSDRIAHRVIYAVAAGCACWLLLDALLWAGWL